MKRLLAIVMLTLILANVAGFYVYFAFRLKEIREEMRETLQHYPVEKLQRIVFTPQQYQHAKIEDQEIEWQGFVYDVARVELQGDDVIVLALRDDAETDLFALINKIIDMTSRDEETPPEALMEFAEMDFTLPTVIPVNPGGLAITVKHTTGLTKTHAFVYLDVLSPPPRQV